MGEMVRIYIIEESRSMRERIGHIVYNTDGLQLAGQSSNVEEAVFRLPAAKADVILMDSDIPGSTENGIRLLLEHSPDVVIICTAQRWDKTLLMMAFRAGAKAYLAKPFNSEALLEAVWTAASNELAEETAGEVITLVSPKGGSGTTTTAANLAVGLAQETGARVGIVDLDLEFGDLAVFYNLAPLATIVDAARDLQQLSMGMLNAYLTPYNQQVRVLTAPPRPEHAESVRDEDIGELLSLMRRLFRYVIVDTSPGFSPPMLAAAQQSERIYLITALNSGREIQHTRAFLETFWSMGYDRRKVRVAFSRVASRDIESLERLEKELNYPVTALLPNDFNLVTASVNGGVTLSVHKPDSPLARGVQDIIRDIAAAGPGAAQLFPMQTVLGKR